ncbi:MAG: PAS domain-containing protein [Bryobacteraceae bacterium]
MLSDRAALQRALAAERRAIETFDSISDGLFVFDAAFHYLYANPQAERITGKSKSQLIGRCLWESCPEKQATDFERVYRKVMLERAPDTFEAHFPGSTRWLEVRVFPNHFTGGLTVFFRDISELKVAREEQARLLQEVCVANHLLSGVMEGSRDLITSIDREYRFTAMNQAYRSTILEMSGRDIQAGMKVTALSFKPHLQIRASDAPWTLALQGQESTAVEEFVLAGASRRMFEVHYSSIRDAAGGVVGASAIARDVTGRRQAEQSLVAAHALLRAQMSQRTDELQEKETLLHEVHHSVKNNLQGNFQPAQHAAQPGGRRACARSLPPKREPHPVHGHDSRVSLPAVQFQLSRSGVVSAPRGRSSGRFVREDRRAMPRHRAARGAEFEGSHSLWIDRQRAGFQLPQTRLPRRRARMHRRACQPPERPRSGERRR